MTTPVTLVIANKNYSSWSLRPWLVMTELGIAFNERMLKFDSEDWAKNIATLSPSRLVPVLWEGEPGKGLPSFDTLAIIERLHELFPDKAVWPRNAEARARARSLCADFHADYRALRAAMPMNLRGRYPGKGMHPEVAQEIERLTGHWLRTRREFGAGGRFLFGDYCAADAYFTPVVSRFVTYGVDLEGEARSYQQTLLGAASFAAWRTAALQETEFVAADEPYALPR